MVLRHILKISIRGKNEITVKSLNVKLFAGRKITYLFFNRMALHHYYL